MNLPLEQSRPHFNGILLKLRFRRENRANASVTQAKGAVVARAEVRAKRIKARMNDRREAAKKAKIDKEARDAQCHL